MYFRKLLCVMLTLVFFVQNASATAGSSPISVAKSPSIDSLGSPPSGASAQVIALAVDGQADRDKDGKDVKSVHTAASDRAEASARRRKRCCTRICLGGVALFAGAAVGYLARS